VGKRVLPILLAGIALAVGCGGGDDGGADDGPPRHVPDRTATDLTGAWWSWAARRPEGEDPVSDTSGGRCAQDQPRGVFFLAGTFGGSAARKCQVPRDTRVFFPVVNMVCDVVGDVERAQQDCGEGIRTARRRVELDGEPLKDVYLEAPPFQFESHPASPVGGGGGQAVAVGWHGDIDRLTPGRHTLRWTAATDDGFALDVRYELTVR
jgi:hypothetical protein